MEVTCVLSRNERLLSHAARCVLVAASPSRAAPGLARLKIINESASNSFGFEKVHVMLEVSPRAPATIEFLPAQRDPENESNGSQVT